ncbi:MAG: cytidine deaminase [Crenarchaeota archaeon]|nr:cytidine deaminase [Thermoproteota archaeon]
MPPECVEALREAEKRLVNSYAPYSGVHVAAAVVDEEGRIHVGVNVENASLGLTICAERAAIAAMVAAGGRRPRCVAIVSDAPQPLPPCGACRQVIAEFAGPDTPIASRSAATGETRLWTLGELLPHAFTPRHISGSGGGEEAGLSRPRPPGGRGG